MNIRSKLDIIARRSEGLVLPSIFAFGIIMGVYCVKRTDYKPLLLVLGITALSISAASLVIMSKDKD
jgi:CHASE2 domain-containing sensor protein